MKSSEPHGYGATNGLADQVNFLQFQLVEHAKKVIGKVVQGPGRGSMNRKGPRILLIGGTYRALCVLEHLLERGERVVAFLGQEREEERDFWISSVNGRTLDSPSSDIQKSAEDGF